MPGNRAAGTYAYARSAFLRRSQEVLREWTLRMAFVEHYRVSMNGTLGPAKHEIFSMNFALARYFEQAETSGSEALPFLDPSATVWTDVANDCAAFVSRADTLIHPDAVLRMVKIAHIGTDGRYLSGAVERPVAAAGGFAPGTRFPNQTALATTLKTKGDLGRIKGRFYMPLVATPVGPDGLIAEAQAEQIESSVATFINAVNNQPGIDVLNLNVAVASQGRRDKFGAIRVQPANWRVRSVGVGRTYDTIRRRRNKLLEETDFTVVS